MPSADPRTDDFVQLHVSIGGSSGMGLRSIAVKSIGDPEGDQSADVAADVTS
jgi:hypothetical protein